MRFLRHLGAVTLVVAAVVLLGLAFDRYGASILVGGSDQQPRAELAAGAPRPGAKISRADVSGRYELIKGKHPRVIRTGSMDLGLDSMLQAVNVPYLTHTLWIEGAVIAGVVVLEVVRRRWRKANRAEQLAYWQYRSEDDADQ
jgi:hypothetical protein